MQDYHLSALSRACSSAIVVLAFALSACGGGNTDTDGQKEQESVDEVYQAKQDQMNDPQADPYLWLEDVDSEKALYWAREKNEEALARLTSHPLYQDIKDSALSVLTASDRIPYGALYGDEVRNFWQDESHVRGIWRRTDLDDYASDKPDWQTILDLDALAEEEEENWVWKGANCFAPDYNRCMLRLSRGGADAVVLREFDVSTGRFIEDGFALAEEKQNVDWVDEDTLLIASPLDGGSKNTSGYARTIRIWNRGEALDAAKTVFTSEENDAFTFPIAIHRPEGTELFVTRAPDFFHETVYHLTADGTLTELNLPADVNFQGLFQGQVIVLLRSAWSVGGLDAKAGAVLSIPLASLRDGDHEGAAILAEPSETTAIEAVRIGRDAVFVTSLEDVKGRLSAYRFTNGIWEQEPVALPDTGSVDIIAANAFSSTLFVNFESFLQPATLYRITDAEKPEPIRQEPARFDAKPFAVEQRFATSDDGTKVPYFLIHAKDEGATSGETPTILYGYGGFEISLTPSYLSPLAMEWLKHGGAYAIANIRGGGEYGPRWHKAALNENRPRAYEDFASVARDLIETGVTAPEHLGIYGGSNGGLLVGATMVRNPELFGAVVSAVPLLDMLRYHKLLAGASWIGEYGDPDIPAERAWIEQYSPYQKVRADADYPPLFLTTSTRDDRVHPGHARKMAAKMADQGHEVLYYENIEGGHAGAANLKQRAMRDALIATWFLQELSANTSGSVGSQPE